MRKERKGTIRDPGAVEVVTLLRSDILSRKEVYFLKLRKNR